MKFPTIFALRVTPKNPKLMIVRPFQRSTQVFENAATIEASEPIVKNRLMLIISRALKIIKI